MTSGRLLPSEEAFEPRAAERRHKKCACEPFGEVSDDVDARLSEQLTGSGARAWSVAVGRTITGVGRRAYDELQKRALAHAGVSLLPILTLSWLTGSRTLSQAALATVAAVVAKETAQLAPAGVLLHALAIMSAFLMLIASLQAPAAFVVAVCLVGVGSVLVTAWGSKLRTVGNFTFIPALYLACEIAEGRSGVSLPRRGVAYLPAIAIAILPVVLIAAVDHARDRDPLTPKLRHHRTLSRRAADAGERPSIVQALTAILLASGTAAILVEHRHFDHGQWVIWSAASVVAGDYAGSRRKLRDRWLGALSGVPVGTILGFILPESDAIRLVAGIAAVLTLLAFRRYVLGFAARCCLVALILVNAGHATFSAVDRVQSVVLGGAIGMFFVLVIHAGQGSIAKSCKQG